MPGAQGCVSSAVPGCGSGAGVPNCAGAVPCPLPCAQGGLPAQVLPDTYERTGRAVPVPDGNTRRAWSGAVP